MQIFGIDAYTLFRYRRVLMLLAVVGVVSLQAFGTQNMPWEVGLGTIKDSLTGPVAGIISILALFACGAVLMFGHDVNEVVKKLIYVVMAIALVVGGATILKTLYSGANTTACTI